MHRKYNSTAFDLKEEHLLAHNNNYVNQSFSIAEWNLYGSSRLGTRAADKVTEVIFLASRSYNWIGNTVTNEVIAPTASFSYKKYRLLGAKTFELTNHLGNVITTISDRKLMVQDAQNLGYVHHYTPKILSIGEQYAFGMSMPGRTFSVEDYRYGFCSKEKDNEIKGEGNSLDYGARIYDSRTARWLSIDPYSSKYSGLSPFAYCANSPIVFKDPDGKDILIYYKDSQGLDAPVPYKYGSGLIIPDNIFVRKTILTLMAISENPDSKSLIDEIANDADYEFRILESPGATTSSPSAIEDWKIYVIDYNPSNGLYEDGTNQILSPFIAFFHEFGHGLDYRSVRKNASKGLTGSAAQNAEVKAGQIWANIQLDPINDPTWHSIKEQTTIEKYENPLANYFNQLIRTSYVNGYFSTFQFYNPLDTKLNQNHGRTIGCGDVERAPTETTPFSNSKEIDLK